MNLEQCKDGVKVNVTRRNGDITRGVITGAPEARGKGSFVPVAYVDETGKKNGKTAWKRASQLAKR
jgi:hypothetical protein